MRGLEQLAVFQARTDRCQSILDYLAERGPTVWESIHGALAENSHEIGQYGAALCTLSVQGKIRFGPGWLGVTVWTLADGKRNGEPVKGEA